MRSETLMDLQRVKVREGLEILGVERVRRAVDTGALEEDAYKTRYKGYETFCHCFLGKAYDVDRENYSRAMDKIKIESGHLLHATTVEEFQNNPILAISSAHYTHSSVLQEEVMIFLAEHGDAQESSCQNILASSTLI